MNIYLCEYCWNGSYGFSISIKCLVSAQTERVALGLCLEKYPETNDRNWDIELLELKDYELLQVFYEET